MQNEKEIVDVVKKERSSYDFEFKLKVINDLKDGKLAACYITAKHGVHKSLATKWKQMERIITYVAEGRKKKLLKKGGASNKHHAVFVKLYHDLRKREVWGEKFPMHGFTLTPIQLMPIKTQAHPVYRKVPPCVSLSTTTSN